MPDVSDLQRFLKVSNCSDGDLITFEDAGNIVTKEFKDDSGKVKINTVIELTVMINGKSKIYTPNATSIQVLQKAWGKHSENWVGKQARILIVPQKQFGELKDTLVLRPMVYPPIGPAQDFTARASVPAQPVREASQPTKNPDGVKTPEEIAWEQ